MKFYCTALLLGLSCLACTTNSTKPVDTINATAVNGSKQLTTITTGKTTPADLITFARSLNGTPYQYGSSDPKQGLDCSGFVTYVFTHFNIAVPRSSADFTNVQQQIDVKEAKPGDLILFTGTDKSIKTVGHMGIIIANDNAGIAFVHATSGKAHGVTETTLSPNYTGRYVKTIRIFPQNN